MITTYAYTGIYIQHGSTWLVGTPLDFPAAFEGVDWELFQCTDVDINTAQQLMVDTSPKDAVVIVKIFPTHGAREEWFRSAQPKGFV